MNIKKPQIELGAGGFGNLNDPQLTGLPTAVAALSGAGANSVWDELSNQPQLGAALANQLRTNPKALILHLFNLTGLQRTVLWQMDEGDLQDRLSDLANAIAAGNVAGVVLTIEPPTARVVDGDENDAPISAELLPVHPVHQPVVVAACKWHVDINFHIENS